MPDTFRTAKQVAENFVARQRLGAGPTANRVGVLGECTWVFFWDEEHPLYEFPIVDRTESPARAGYVLVSGNDDLPPVLEYSLDARPLSSQLNSYLHSSLTVLLEVPSDVTWFYWNGLEPVARVKLVGRASPVFIQVPECRVYPLAAEQRILRDPRDSWSVEEVRRRWNEIRDLETVRVESSTQLWYNPVRYQQGCDAYGADCRLGSDPGHTYCTPHCIAGCTPVCWAMLASCWKKHGQGGASTKIWSGSGCWGLEWPSSTNPSRCGDVSASIWDFHRYMGTGCAGDTDWNNIIAGGRIFHDKWGLPWQWGRRDNQDYGFVKSVIDHGQPCHFSALGQWNSYAANLLRADETSGGGPGQEGHSIVAYGYDDAQSAVKICLGWGTWYADKYIRVSDYTRNQCVFVTGWSAGAKTTSTVARAAGAAS